MPLHVAIFSVFFAAMECADMVRHYQRTKCQKYTSEQLLVAIRSVKERGMKVPVAADKYHVPLSTLYDHIREHRSDQNRGWGTHHPHQG